MSANARKGAFQIRCSTSVVNEQGTYWGVVPKPCSRLKMYEDYFVTSLERDKAYDVFIDTILNHIIDVHENSPHAVAALIGDSGREDSSYIWTVEQIKGERTRVMLELKKHVREKSRLYIQAYARCGPDYLSVTKDLIMHHSDGRGKSSDTHLTCI